MIVGLLNISGNVAFTVLGAVAVSALTAFVTAYTTNRRLDKQLKAEKERVDAQVKAENARHLEQLSHDRELSDLAELRSLLDETSRLISGAVKTSAQVSANWSSREDSEARERLEGQQQLLRNEVVEIVERHQRVMLRLSRDSDVSQSLNDVRERIGKLLVLSSSPSVNEEDAQAMANGVLAREIAAAHVAFLDASRTLVGSDLPSRS